MILTETQARRTILDANGPEDIIEMLIQLNTSSRYVVDVYIQQHPYDALSNRFLVTYNDSNDHVILNLEELTKMVVEASQVEHDRNSARVAKMLEKSMTVGSDTLANRFTYHEPKESQIEVYSQIREKALEFAKLIETVVPEGSEKRNAIDKIDEAVMWANAGISRKE